MRLRRYFAALLCYVFLSSAAQAQFMNDSDIQRFFDDRKSFGHVNSDRRSWNAYYTPDGTTVWWSRNFKITRGRWWISNHRLCVDLDQTSCRMPFLRGDGVIDWIDPSTNQATSTLVRLETDDVLGLGLRGNRSEYVQDPIYNGKYRTFPEEVRWVQTHSFRELYPATQMATAMRGKGFDYAVVSSARNGWHAVLLGTLLPTAMYLVEYWKRQGLIPQDSRTNASRRFYKFDTPPPLRPPACAVRTRPAPTPAPGSSCSAKEYTDLHNAC